MTVSIEIGFLETFWQFLRPYFWCLKFAARSLKNPSCILEVYALTLRVIVKFEVMIIMILHGLFNEKSPFQASFPSWLVSRSFRKKWGGTVFCAFLEGFPFTPGPQQGCRSFQNSHHSPSPLWFCVFVLISPSLFVFVFTPSVKGE